MLAEGGTEVGVRRADDPHVDRFAAGASQPPHRTLLNDLEQLGLKRLAEQPNLVKEYRARVRGLKQAWLGVLRAGERAALEAEEFGLQQRFRDGRAVHVDEGVAGSGPFPVEEVRDQPLTGPRLSHEENRRRSTGAGRSAQEPADVR